jgi:pyruvate formate lyase activating enzyme
VFPEEEILSFLSKRRGMLEGVVVSGGEPFLQDQLLDFLKKIKTMGYLVKVDTNGAYPQPLEELLDTRMVDYIAMDVKAPKNKYNILTGVSVDLSKIETSIDLIRTRAPAYEFRTTFVPSLLTKEDIIDIAQWLEGAKTYYLQQFKPMTPLISSPLETAAPYAKEYFLETLKAIQPFFKNCHIRGI